MYIFHLPTSRQLDLLSHIIGLHFSGIYGHSIFQIILKAGNQFFQNTIYLKNILLFSYRIHFIHSLPYINLFQVYIFGLSANSARNVYFFVLLFTIFSSVLAHILWMVETNWLCLDNNSTFIWRIIVSLFFRQYIVSFRFRTFFSARTMLVTQQQIRETLESEHQEPSHFSEVHCLCSPL